MYGYTYREMLLSILKHTIIYYVLLFSNYLHIYIITYIILNNTYNQRNNTQYIFKIIIENNTQTTTPSFIAAIHPGLHPGIARGGHEVTTQAQEPQEGVLRLRPIKWGGPKLPSGKLT